MKPSKILNTRMIQIFICFSLPWLMYFLLLLFGKELYYFWGRDEYLERMVWIPQNIWFWCNFLPGFFLFGIGLSLNYAAGKIKKIPLRKIIITMLILIIVDQIIQFLVVTYHESISIVIIKDWLAITPVPAQSAESGYLSSARMPVSLHVALNLLAVPAVYFVYRFLHFFEEDRTHLFISVLFFAAGLTCSCLSLIFYNGNVYDYIKIYPLIIFDLKDLYLDIGVSTLFLSMLLNIRALKKGRLKDYIKHDRKGE